MADSFYGLRKEIPVVRITWGSKYVKKYGIIHLGNFCFCFWFCCTLAGWLHYGQHANLLVSLVYLLSVQLVMRANFWVKELDLVNA